MSFIYSDRCSSERTVCQREEGSISLRQLKSGSQFQFLYLFPYLTNLFSCIFFSFIFDMCHISMEKNNKAHSTAFMIIRFARRFSCWFLLECCRILNMCFCWWISTARSVYLENPKNHVKSEFIRPRVGYYFHRFFLHKSDDFIIKSFSISNLVVLLITQLIIIDKIPHCDIVKRSKDRQRQNLEKTKNQNHRIELILLVFAVLCSLLHKLLSKLDSEQKYFAISKANDVKWICPIKTRVKWVRCARHHTH